MKNPNDAPKMRRKNGKRKPRKGEFGKCYLCGTSDDVSCLPDPYSHDIWGDDTPKWICSKCYRDRAEAI